MMLIILIGLAVGAAYVCRDTPLFIPAVIVAICSFWSNGVMSNFRRTHEVPRLATAVSLICFVFTLIFGVTGLIIS
ncbi:hypothetical protein [Streptomyces cadmiisoli]|uniref:Uncharacterized protein n=1 Tax=Streptomyces cadmiisoli TaxID=2184053 RepID=A0A2Z4J170_9ACTN|nr:hypothetical protein [Streptomyces cadmiisoli]AWW38757.1 hypothetical protein DN051_20540 [Streptomyces cadmiisoli]